MINPYNYPYDVMFNGSDIPEDDYFLPLPFYQLLREKEKIIKEYKFKYETTKSMYKDILKSMKKTHEKSIKPHKIGHFISEILDIFLEEIENLNLREEKIRQISESLYNKFDRVISRFEFGGQEKEKEEKIKHKAEKKKRNIEKNLDYLQKELSLKRESIMSKSARNTHVNISPEQNFYATDKENHENIEFKIGKSNDSTGENSKGDDRKIEGRQSLGTITNIFEAMRVSQRSECMRQESLDSGLRVQSIENHSKKKQNFLKRNTPKSEKLLKQNTD